MTTSLCFANTKHLGKYKN